MKKFGLVVVLQFVISFHSYAQWYPQNSGTTSDLTTVFFVNENVGYMVGGFNIFKTTDGGNVWLNISTTDSISIKGLFFINMQIGWFTFQDYENYSAGIYKTTDGGFTWNLQLTTDQDTNMGELQFIDPLNGWCLVVWSMANGRLYKTTNGGQTWSDTLTDVNLASGLCFLDINTGWIAGGTIAKTTNSGITWNVQLNIDPKYFSYIQFTNIDTGWAFSRGWQDNPIYKTTNSGQSWFQQYNFPFHNIRFVDGSYGYGLAGSNIYKTTNGGDNWELQYVDPLNSFSDIFFVNRNKCWVVGENGIVLTTDNGGIPVELTSFTSSVSINDVTLNWLTATETNNQGFQIERRNVQDESYDDWNSFGFVTGNGTTTEPQSYSFADKNLEAGKYQYRLKQIDFDGTFEYSNKIEVEINVPLKFSLGQNYPNPFNPSTSIQYAIASRQFVTLKVYDVLGNEIATLVNEEKPAGNYDVEFNASHMASGIYYYQLRAGEFVETKKMILMK